MTAAVDPTDVDSNPVIAAGICLAVIGIAFFMAMPVIVGALADYSGFSARQAGLLAAAENSGAILASLLTAALVNRVNRQTLAKAMILIAVTTNLLATQATDFYPLAVCRVVAGFGAGGMYALGLASLAASRHSSRNFSILLFVQVAFGMLEINLYAAVAQHYGVQGIYVCMAIFMASCLALIPWLPTQANPAGTTNHHSGKATPRFALPWFCLSAIAVFYVACSALWAYIERIGRGGGLSNEWVASSLSYTQLLSLLGCVIASWLSTRFGNLKPLLVSLALVACASASLTGDVTIISYVLALSVFFLFWNAIDIYQLASLSDIDHSGRYVALVPAFQNTASAIGPGIGAGVLGSTGNYDVLLICVSTLIFGAALINFVGFSFLAKPLSYEDKAVAHSDNVINAGNDEDSG